MGCGSRRCSHAQRLGGCPVTHSKFKRANFISLSEARRILGVTPIKTESKDRWFLDLGESRKSSKSPASAARSAAVMASKVCRSIHQQPRAPECRSQQRDRRGAVPRITIPSGAWREMASDKARLRREGQGDGRSTGATTQLMGEATRQIKVATWISSIHFHQLYACARAASLIADRTGGRMILGLGASHLPVNTDLVGVDMPSPTVGSRRYATEVTGWLRAEGPATHLPQGPPPVPVPLYLAATISPMVQSAGELCGRRDALHVVGGASEAQ
jgi:hypothetical protein